MNMKMISKWAAAAALACITSVSVNAQIQYDEHTYSLLNITSPVSPTSTASLVAFDSAALTSAGLSGGIKLSDLVWHDADHADSISLTIAATNSSDTFAYGKTLSFGFASATNAFYVLDGGSANGKDVFRYRPLLAMGTSGGDYKTYHDFSLYTFTAANDKDINKVGSFTFTISKAEAANTYTFKLYYGDTSGGNNALYASQDIDLANITVDTGGYALTGASQLLTGIGLRNQTDKTIDINTLTASYLQYEAVPEPSTWMLLGSSVALLAFLRRRK